MRENARVSNIKAARRRRPDRQPKERVPPSRRLQLVYRARIVLGLAAVLVFTAGSSGFQQGPGSLNEMPRPQRVAPEVELGLFPVKGIPLTAEAVTESVQQLAGGNTITRRSTSVLYRDRDGRVRREYRLTAVGPWALPGGPMTATLILDPPAGVRYVLNPMSRTARKLPFRDRGASLKSQIFGAPPAASRATQPRTDALGRKRVEGIEAVGTRTVATIPAGIVGNQDPIETIHERWVSPELQVLVLSRHVDPRFGEYVYKITKLTPGDPPAALFQMPPDYTLK